MKTTQLLAIVAENPSAIENLTVLNKAYDAGASTILSEIACMRLGILEESNSLVFTKSCKEAEAKLNKLYIEIKEKYPNGDLRATMSRLDDQATFWASMFGESQFIQGFMEGYKFAKAAIGEN